MLDPTPTQAALVEEAVESALHSGKHDDAEQEWLEEFKRDLSRHRQA